MTLPYTHLSLAERCAIACLHAAKIPIRVMADRLQRHRSTIYRKTKRNWVHDEEPLYRGYYHVAADMLARSAPAYRQALPQTCSGRLRDRQAQGGVVSRTDCGPPAGIRCV